MTRALAIRFGAVYEVRSPFIMDIRGNKNTKMHTINDGKFSVTHATRCHFETYRLDI